MTAATDTRHPCDWQEAANYNERRTAAVDILVLHYTGMESGEAALSRLCEEASGVSCHYIVFEDGRCLQMVSEKYRAWHAGKSEWRGEEDVNSCSIGIEIVNPGHELGYSDFPPEQVSGLIGLCKDILERNHIPARNIVAHSDIAPGRKIDPGEKFPWAVLAEAGVGHHVAPARITGGRFFQEGDYGEPVAALQAMLAEYGYGIGTSGRYGARTRSVVDAFQRHFRQERVDGIADVSTIETLFRLCKCINES